MLSLSFALFGCFFFTQFLKNVHAFPLVSEPLSQIEFKLTRRRSEGHTCASTRTGVDLVRTAFK